MAEERRVVTILFSDVTGSTAMGESSDPEDVRAILGRYYAIAREVIGSHGGTVEKFIGDAVMAVFGIPHAHGDDAERALASALALRQAVANDPQTESLALRIGVNTGEVVAARRTDASDFLVTGDAVNVAARLQQSAEPGAIMVGGRTRRAVTGFAFGEERRLDVKGKREPIDASVLVDRLADRRGPLAPFLGRGDDLAQLDLVARRAFSERRPQLVTITAPAGTGKSRLVEEFARRVEGATVATAQCLPYGAAVTFLPLRGLVRSLFDVASDEDLWAAIENGFIDAGHPAEDARRLATIIGMTLGDEAGSERRDRDEVFSAWRLLIETFAARGPLVVVFEDRHWASDTLLDLAEHITTSRMATPLVIFALARPELLDRKPGWGGGRRNFTSLGLEPLSETQTRELVGRLTEGAPASIAGRIVERSGGNPFFAAELARAYQERRRQGATDDEIVLPDSVHATVLARIDALPAEERSILELGAVTGRTIRAAAIHALMPENDEERIARALDDLAQRDLLVPQGTGAYTFRHIVIREVAYATLPRAERVKAHLRLAQWLETHAAARSNERAELVAYHYRQAMALSPGGRLPENLPATVVVDALERAARAASTATAHREASELLREAIRLAPKEDHIRLLELWGDLVQIGSDAMNAYQTAYERWNGTPGPQRDPRVGARVLVKSLLLFARWAGSLAKPLTHEEFVASADEASRLLARTPDDVVEAWLACARGFELTRYKLPDPATVARMIADVERAVALFASRGDAEAESATLDALGSVHQSSGDSTKALEVARQRIGASSGLSLLERVDAWAAAVWNLVYLGRYDEAIATWREARKAIRAGEPAFMLAHATGWAAYAAAVSGRWDTAIEIADVLLGLREDASQLAMRFTYPGWVGALRVASARQDTTRLARYASVFASIAAPEGLHEPHRSAWTAIMDRDAAAAKRYLCAPFGPRDRQGELIGLLIFELDERLTEEEIAAVEGHSRHGPPVLALRVQLARAVNADPAALRRAVAALDDGHLAPDAARAATLLALRTRDPADRADAGRRLEALGDRAYLQKLQEG